MKSEERIPMKVKKAWQTPEIIDLDVKMETDGKTLDGGESPADCQGPS